MTIQKHSQTSLEPIRPTVIRTPRETSLFTGWGVKV